MFESIGFFLIVFFIFAIISYTILKKFRFCDVSMKIAEFVITVAASVGVLLTIYGIGVSTEENKCRAYEMDAQLLGAQLVQILNEEKYNVEPVRTEFSPSNYDDIVIDDSLRYLWIKGNKKYVQECCIKADSINWDSLNYPMCHSDSQVFIEDDSIIKSKVYEYNAKALKFDVQRKTVKEYNETFVSFSRYNNLLLLLSLALFCVKWGYEFSHKKEIHKIIHKIKTWFCKK